MSSRNRLVAVSALILVLMFATIKSYAFNTFAINCVNNVIDLGAGLINIHVNITISNWTDDGAGRDHGSHVYSDANGNELGFIGEVHFHNYSGPVTWYTLNVGAVAGPYRIDVYDLAAFPVNITQAKAGTLITTYWIYPNSVYPYCGSAVTSGPASTSAGTSSSTESGIVYPPDTRINWQYGDLGVVLFRGTDATGEAAINAYCYDGTNAWLGMQVNSANMQSGMTGDGCDVSFYFIENSDYPYQWNILFDAKLYEVHCSDLTCEVRYVTYFDPNE